MIPNSRTVYKAVRQNDGTFSSIMLDRESKYTLNYKIGEKAVPKIGYIFAFNWFEQANDFLREADYYYPFSGVILQGTAVMSDEYFDIVARPVDNSISYFWDKPAVRGTLFIPAGTVFCRSFTPHVIIERA